MLRTMKVCFGALLLSLFLSSGAPAAQAADQTGNVLVDKLVTLFNQTANSTTARYDTINQAITDMMVQAKGAKAEQRIDGDFFNRYTRVLRIFKLKITEDQEGILGPVADQEYIAFVKAATGKELQGVPSTAVLGQAVTQELANLRKP